MGLPLLRIGRRAHTAGFVCFGMLAISLPGPETIELPHAQWQPPHFLRGKIPFDADRFFLHLSEPENAAPIYLRAFSEFDASMSDCWPQAVRDERYRTIRAREDRVFGLLGEIEEHPDKVEAARLDEVLALHEDGWQAIAEAQRRPLCLFPINLTVRYWIPHANAVRAVVRAAELRVFRQLQIGELDAAIETLGATLRVCRDLRRRGNLPCQLASVASGNAACLRLATSILRNPGITDGQLDRLIELTRLHEVEALDPFAEGVRAEYFPVRIALQSLRDDPTKRAAAIQELTGEAPLLDWPGLLQDDHGVLRDPERVKVLAKEVAGRLGRMTTADFEATIARTNSLYRSLTEIPAGIARVRAAACREREARYLGTDPLLAVLTSRHETLVEMSARGLAYVRVVRALAAVRRWEIRHGTLPATLESACLAAAMPGIPADPYADRPLSLVIRAGKPVVYSVGRDGEDDGGFFDPRPGAFEQWDLSLSYGGHGPAAPRD